MPGDVAVHKPRARVVGFEGDDEEAGCGEEHDVAAGRVVEVDGGLEEKILVATGAFCDDEKVVAVEVEGVCGCFCELSHLCNHLNRGMGMGRNIPGRRL